MSGGTYLGQLRSFVWRWLTTTNHKDIGILYIVTSIYFSLVAGILGMLIRLQLMRPDNTLLTGNEYNKVVTMHSLFMLLWFVSPLAFGLTNYIVPLQIGARDLAFPRLNALSYWLYLVSGLIALISFFAPGSTASVSWTLYTPLTSDIYSPSKGLDLVGLAVTILNVSNP